MLALMQSFVGKPTWTEDVSWIPRSATTRRAWGQTVSTSL